METMSSFRPNNHKFAHRMLTYGPILTIQSSSESMKCASSYGNSINSSIETKS